MNVLVIDDDKLICGLCRRIFEYGGHKAETFTSLDEALSLDFDPDVILLDLYRNDGYSGLESIRYLADRYSHSAIILMSGEDRSGMDSLLSGSSVKVAGYVIKPFDVRTILADVQRFYESFNSSYLSVAH